MFPIFFLAAPWLQFNGIDFSFTKLNLNYTCIGKLDGKACKGKRLENLLLFFQKSCLWPNRRGYRCTNPQFSPRYIWMFCSKAADDLINRATKRAVSTIDSSDNQWRFYGGPGGTAPINFRPFRFVEIFASSPDPLSFPFSSGPWRSEIFPARTAPGDNEEALDALLQRGGTLKIYKKILQKLMLEI